MQPERAVEAEGVRVGEQLGDIETLPQRRIIGPLNPEAVSSAVTKSRGKAAKHSVVAAVHRGAKNLAVAVIKAKKDAFGVRQIERRLEPVRRGDDPEARRRSAHAAGRAIDR